MQIEAAAAGIGPEEFWEMIPRDVEIQIRGFGRRLRYLALVIAQYGGGPAAAVWSKGADRNLTKAALKALEEY